MNTRHDADARKRPVNLTLNENLVQQAKEMTDNLSGVVESLLAEFVERERKRRMAAAKTIEVTIAVWNAFDADVDSFSDEYSTL